MGMGNGERGMENEEWRMGVGNGEWRMENGKRHDWTRLLQCSSAVA